MSVAIVRESLASVRSQPVASTLTVIIIASMIVTIVLTAGRTIAAERAVLQSIDSTGTRSIVIRADADSGLSTDVLDRLATIEGIQWSAAFSSAVDARNEVIRGGNQVSIRRVFGPHLEVLGLPHLPAVQGLAYGSPSALETLGLQDFVGSVRTTTGLEFGISGAIAMPEFLDWLEPLVIVPEPPPTQPDSVNILIVIAKSPSQVGPVADAALSVLGVVDPTRIDVQTSERLADLRVLVEGQMGSFARGLILALLALTSTLVFFTLWGLVMMRRKDFGRRRALGATRGTIVALVLVQTVLLAITGVIAGSVAAASIIAVGGDPMPDVQLMSAIALLAIGSALISAVIPAIVASTREPIRELRVP